MTPMTATGTLVDPQTIRLDAPLSVAAAGRVTVTVTAGEPPQPLDGPDFLRFMETIWDEARQEGRVPPTPEEVDARLRDARAGWGD